MTSKRTLVLIGCGNIGSRHLESLIKLNIPFHFHIVENNPQVMLQAKSRYKLMINNKNIHNFSWYSNIDELNVNPDLTIVATTSSGRISIIDKLLEKNYKRFLIEKIVCQSKHEYDYLLSRFKKTNSKGWINFPRRYFPAYQRINKLVKNPIKISIIGGNLGLGSNASHFIDLFTWLSGNAFVHLNGKCLKNEILSNKKRGPKFKEFLGTINGFAGKSSLSISFIPLENMPLIIEISSKNSTFLINESEEKIVSNISKLEFSYVHTSNLTHKIVLDILKSDSCLLPSIEHSYQTHLELFRIFNLHIKKISNKKITLCPIT